MGLAFELSKVAIQNFPTVVILNTMFHFIFSVSLALDTIAMLIDVCSISSLGPVDQFTRYFARTDAAKI